MMKYELWDADSGNRIGGFDGMKELGRVVRAYAELNGEESIDVLFAEGWEAGAAQPSEQLDALSLRRLALPLIRYVEVPKALRAATSTGARPVLVGPGLPIPT